MLEPAHGILVSKGCPTGFRNVQGMMGTGSAWCVTAGVGIYQLMQLGATRGSQNKRRHIGSDSLAKVILWQCASVHCAGAEQCSKVLGA